MNKIIKKVLSCCFIILLFVLSGQMVYADSVNQLEAQGAGQLVQIKENSEKSEFIIHSNKTDKTKLSEFWPEERTLTVSGLLII